jgi:hypothetical protein
MCCPAAEELSAGSLQPQLLLVRLGLCIGWAQLCQLPCPLTAAASMLIIGHRVVCSLNPPNPYTLMHEMLLLPILAAPRHSFPPAPPGGCLLSDR